MFRSKTPKSCAPFLPPPPPPVVCFGDTGRPLSVTLMQPDIDELSDPKIIEDVNNMVIDVNNMVIDTIPGFHSHT